VIVSLAMFLTLFVMTPTLTDAYRQGIQPMMNNQSPPNRVSPRPWCR
jgi:flagellar biosynthetic protein FliP